MTEEFSFPSADGAQYNQVPGSLEIENSVRLIVDEYLKTPLQSEQINSVKNALQVAATANRQIFQNNIQFLNRVIQKLITYCINIIIEFENQQKIAHNCEIFEDILIDFISIYPARLRDMFTQRLIKAIQEHYLPETQNQTSVILPNFDDKSLRIKCHPGKASYFYLSLFLKMAQKFPVYDATLLELIQILLVTKNEDIQIMAIKLLAEFMAISTHTSFKIIRITLSFVAINFQAFVQNEEIDDLIVAIFSKAYNTIPNNVKPLIGREILNYLPSLKTIIDWKIMDTVLKCVYDFVSSDHVNAQLSASFFMKLFPDYFMKDTFIDICKIIVRHSPNFKAAIWKQFQYDFVHLSALLELSPDNVFNINILNDVNPPNLYDIVSRLKDIPGWLMYKVKKHLLTCPPPPSPRIIKSLIKLIPAEVLTSYSPDILCLILTENESMISQNYKILKRYALQTDNIKLVSLLAARHPEDQIDYSRTISNSAHDPNVWEDENFRKSIAIIRQNDKESTFQKEFFLKLYEKSRLRLMYLYAQEESLWKQFLKPILQAINGVSDNHAAAAISVLHQLNNFQDIYAHHSYYFFKHLLTLLRNPNHSHRFKSIIMCLFPQSKLIRFSSKIIPILIRYQDKMGITIYAQMCNDAQKPATDINEYINKLILESIPDIFVYLFVYVGIKERLFSEAISFLQNMLNGVQPTSLLNNRVGIIGPQLLLYLGSDNPKHKKNAIESINLINMLCYKKSLKDTSEIMKFFWDQNFFVTIIDFSRILCDNKSRRNTEVFKSLINSVEYLEPFIRTCYPKILSITDIAMRKDSLRFLCIEFWLKLMNAITEKTIFSNIFGHIISQLLPYFDQYPDQITSVLRILIVDNVSITQHCFIEIAHIPLFHEKEQLQEINSVLHNAVISDDWKSRIVKLAKQLDTTAPPFKRLILQQLRITLKAHQNELTVHATSDLMRKLWLISTHEKTSEHILYCAQCMALLPFDKETSPPEQKAVENDHCLIIRSIITDYLVKSLEDSSSLMNHDHAAYAIQQLLKVIGCAGKANESDESLRQDKTWNLFPGDIQNIIFPFLKSRYRSDERTESFEPLSRSIPSTVNHWLCNLALYLLDLSTGSTVYFKHCSCVLPDSPSLCKFFLPYLCIENKNNDVFTKALRKQWSKLHNLLNGNNGHQREFARQALRILFSLFDILAAFSINVGEERGNLSEGTTLGIASEISLAEAAIQCELYQRALQHYEFYIRDGTGKFADCKEKLLEIYEHIDDPDGFEFLSRSKQNDFDDALVSLESQSLSMRSDPKKTLKLIHAMILEGRYERALSDAVLLKNSEPYNIEIDAVIANAAVRLQRWNEISLLNLPTGYKFIAPNHQQNVLDIITARLLYFKKTNNKIDFEKGIQAFGETIVPMFSSAANISYFRLIPILAQIRLVEEIEEFSSENTSFCHWEHEIPMKPIEIERVVAVRSALIASFVDKEKGSMSMITNQWLQLARYCRKSSDLLNSKVFCSRAKIFVSSDSEHSVDLMYCSFEMAKIYWGLNHSNAALALLKQIFPEDDKILCSKVKYIEANWSEKVSSSDTKTIIETYQESANLHQTGKAYLAIANVTDQRVMGFTNYLDQLAQDGGNSNAGGSCAAQIRRNNAKFWTSSTQPANVFSFLKEQIPLALSNFMKAMIYSPLYSFEVIPRILVLFFDIGAHLIPNNEKNLFHMITINHKATILSAMKEAIISSLQKVKSSIWVNSITQLISRIEQPSNLLDTLHRLIQPALQDYPQATFWHLMSVKRSASRNQCYFKLWEFFQSEFRVLYELKEINDLEIKFDTITPLLLNLISYAPKKNGKTFEIQASEIIPELLKEFQNSKLIMPLSSSLMIQSTMTPQQYINSVPLIQSMNSAIYVFPSLQNPKKITIQSTTGNIYHYLCKKDDDLRKDMRMMEFGSFVRSILSRDKRCRQRTLSIVTFAVVCLDERSGIIEWVEHTAGLRNIVENILRKLEKGIPIDKLRQLFCDGTRMEPSALMRKKQENFINQILPAYPPVMHLFFANNFKDVSRWLQARLTYTRSTAVWSMVGYIVGLGDRHAENILYSVKTGACLHVDFSVLFDKGKTLAIPEIVPFRMTQNIVDGMGILGTDGAFSAAATLVMEILKEKKQKILSVLQTFIHDPLIEWKGRDGMDKTMAVVQAKLTLKEVERRLSGIAEDKSSTRSPECVVQELIKQATDNMNLALMFVGWQPYL